VLLLQGSKGELRLDYHAFAISFLSEKGAYPVIHMSGVTTDAVGDVECSHPRTRNSTKL